MRGVMHLMITCAGECRCVYGEQIDLTSVGALTIRRASHVEPDAAGRWSADLSPVGGPRLGPFNRRSEALESEERWVDEHLHRIGLTPGREVP